MVLRRGSCECLGGRLWGEIRRCVWLSVAREICGRRVEGCLQGFGGYILDICGGCWGC